MCNQSHCLVSMGYYGWKNCYSRGNLENQVQLTPTNLHTIVPKQEDPVFQLEIVPSLNESTETTERRTERKGGEQRQNEGRMQLESCPVEKGNGQGWASEHLPVSNISNKYSDQMPSQILKWLVFHVDLLWCG